MTTWTDLSSGAVGACPAPDDTTCGAGGVAAVDVPTSGPSLSLDVGGPAPSAAAS